MFSHFVVRHKIHDQNLSLSHTGPFVKRIVFPIAAVIVSVGKILLIFAIMCTKSNFNFSCNALG